MLLRIQSVSLLNIFNYFVIQVDASIEKLLSEHLVITPSTLGAKLACNLSKLYLPRKAELGQPSHRDHVNNKTVKKPAAQTKPFAIKSNTKRKPLRTTLR